MSAIGIKNRYDGQLEKEDFLSLVRHYENTFKRISKEQGISVSPIGGDGFPHEEAIKFKSIHTLGFTLDKIQSLNRDEFGRERNEYLVSFIGILGSSGVMPQHYIKLALERIKHGDFALSEFIGLFEHRLISLYYKALGKYKLPIQFENTEGNEEDNFTRALKGYSGFFNNNDAQLYYSGHFSKSNRPLVNLKVIVGELIEADVSIKSLVGSWLPISIDDRCKSGVRGKNNQLGSGVILGKRYWDIQSKIIIQINDINIKKYEALKNDKPLYKLLVSVIDSYVPLHINVGLEFTVNCDKNEITELGKGFQLGGNAWLMSQAKNKLVSKRELIRK